MSATPSSQSSASLVEHGESLKMVICAWASCFPLSWALALSAPLYHPDVYPVPAGLDRAAGGRPAVAQHPFTAVMMPVVATLIQKGVQQQYLIAAGMFIFYILCKLCYQIIVPDTSSGDFFWPLIVRGFRLGLLSVPVSTMSLSTLKGQEIGQGAAFTCMMRQLGGSSG
jgi:hypothetical protein